MPPIPFAYLAIWAVLGVAMAAGLYTPAFSSLGRIFGAEARRPITTLTLIGGFASTVSWPTTYFLIEKAGLRGTFLIYAALLALVAAPLHAFALPRQHAHSRPAAPDKIAPTQKPLPARGAIFLLVAAAFAAYAFVPSALGAHMLAIFDRMGLEPRTVVLIGMLFGPAQVAARLCEFFFAREVHPLLIARGAAALMLVAFLLLALFGVSTPVAAAFADPVRRLQRPDHDRHRNGAARPVRRRGLWPLARPHRRPLAPAAGDRAAHHRLRRRALVRPGGAGHHRSLRSRRIRSASCSSAARPERQPSVNHDRKQAPAAARRAPAFTDQSSGLVRDKYGGAMSARQLPQFDALYRVRRCAH